VAGVAVSVAAAAVGLLFTVKPNLKPCLSGTNAAFTGAPIFPHVHFREHLIRSGTAREQAAQELNLLGAEVRFSYRLDGLRGHQLTITWSLVRVEHDGTLGPVDPTQDRAIAETFVPDECSTLRGKDLFVQIPQPRRRYRIVLELYGDSDLRDRLALTETATFRG
jgi:hypothetical protein